MIKYRKDRMGYRRGVQFTLQPITSEFDPREMEVSGWKDLQCNPIEVCPGARADRSKLERGDGSRERYRADPQPPKALFFRGVCLRSRASLTPRNPAAPTTAGVKRQQTVFANRGHSSFTAD